MTHDEQHRLACAYAVGLLSRIAPGAIQAIAILSSTGARYRRIQRQLLALIAEKDLAK